MKKSLHLVVILIAITSTFKIYCQKNDSSLYKNPLCFYNTDVLNYLQILHKNQQYEKMYVFLYGPAIQGKTKSILINKLSNASFGYSMKRVGIREKSKTSWSLTYQRTILGTNETFKIDCALINDKCKLYIDEKVWNTLFKP